MVAGLASKGIAARRLDLDDVGTELGEKQDADGSRHAPAQIEHPHPPQRACWLGHGLCRCRDPLLGPLVSEDAHDADQVASES